MKSQNLFSGKNKRYFNMSSDKHFSQSAKRYPLHVKKVFGTCADMECPHHFESAQSNQGIRYPLTGSLTILNIYQEPQGLYSLLHYENTPIQIQWNLDNSKSKGSNSFLWIIETLNNWGLKCIHIFQLGLQNDFELLRILNYWSLNYRGSTVYRKFHHQKLKIFR